ncbi:MAG TPA: hypothetical protein VFT43_07675, partial [Candidatus Polarisedimenticolia bacterium]|nr:hypothetical protein [Candidatus Polarisedimenticolia bacterium]
RLVAASLERGRRDLERGRITHHESVSKATIENAVEWLILGHFLRESAEGEVGPPRDPQGLRSVVDRMNPLLGS